MFENNFTRIPFTVGGYVDENMDINHKPICISFLYNTNSNISDWAAQLINQYCINPNININNFNTNI